MPQPMHEPLTLAQVRHVAKLARLRLRDDQLEIYRTQLATVLAHLAKLNELDVTGVEPMAHPTDINNRFEEDQIGQVMPIEKLLSNAPSVEDRYLAVPKVLADAGGA